MTTGQIGDGREAAAVDYVLNNAKAGHIDGVLATMDPFAYEKSMLLNVGDAKGALLDAAVRRTDPALALESQGPLKSVFSGNFASGRAWIQITEVITRSG